MRARLSWLARSDISCIRVNESFEFVLHRVRETMGECQRSMIFSQSVLYDSDVAVRWSIRTNSTFFVSKRVIRRSDYCRTLLLPLLIIRNSSVHFTVNSSVPVAHLYIFYWRTFSWTDVCWWEHIFLSLSLRAANESNFVNSVRAKNLHEKLTFRAVLSFFTKLSFPFFFQSLK